MAAAPAVESAHLLRCSMHTGLTSGATSRRLPRQAAPQTLLACIDGKLRLLRGADARGLLSVGPPLQLYAEPAQGGGGGRQPYTAEESPLLYPAWDEWSAAVYMVQESSIVRLTADDTVTVVAGSLGGSGYADGAGGAARFQSCTAIAADGRGRLYVADSSRIRQLQLPAAWEAGGAAGMGAGGAGGAAAAGGEVVVTTLPLRAPAHVYGVAFDGTSSGEDGSYSLVFVTNAAAYRLRLESEGAAAAAVPVLLAASERGAADGVRSEYIPGLALDGEGCAFVAYWHDPSGTTAVRRIARDGAVTTIIALQGICTHPTILPNGYLALRTEAHLAVLDLGLRLPPGHAGLPPPPPQPAGPPPRSLAGDWGAVLDRQPDGSSDLTIVVAGGCPFRVHRLVLCTRSDYYARCLGSGFAEGADVQQPQPQQQLALPDVDPEVFKLALRFMYTGDVDVPPALAQGLAELADRLLLPELCAAAQAVVEAGVTPGSAVGALLWAEAAGPSFAALLGRLKVWYVEHHEEVLEQAEASIDRLAGESPGLMAELTKGSFRAAKRARTN